MAKHATKRRKRFSYQTPLLMGLLGLSVLLLAVAGVRSHIATPSKKPCGEVSALTSGLGQAHDAGLRKLTQYETMCQGKVEAKSALFVATPSSVQAAEDYAQNTATILNEYAQYHVAPLVFMEPADDSGNKLDLNRYAAGAYDGALAAYFAGLKAHGVSDADMGLWTLLPEGNIPEWTSVNPAIYASVVTRTAQGLKQVFPGAKITILLDSRTYPKNSYENPQYVSWQPYVSPLPKGLINSVGLQAYPDTAITDPAVYMRTNFLTEAAQTLGVKDVWVSTGTYAIMKDPDSGQTVSQLMAQREHVLSQVAERMGAVQAQGFQASVMLFAPDKSATTEATNWSYWPAQKPSGSGIEVVQRFIQKLQAGGLQFWVYDSYDE